MMVRNAWYGVGWSTEFEGGELVEKTLAGLPLVMWSTEKNQVVALDNRCAHKRFPLSKGRLVEGRLECAYHGFKYDHKGTCVAIPALMDSEAIPEKTSVRAFPVREQDGIVWVWSGAHGVDASDGPPSVAPLKGGPSTLVHGKTYRVQAPMELLIENLMDLTHFYPLHESTIGNVENNRIPVHVEEIGDTGVTATRTVSDYKLPPSYQEWFGFDVGDRQHIMRMANPSLITVAMRIAPPGMLGTEEESGYTIIHLVYPESSEVFHWRYAVATPLNRTTANGLSLAEEKAAALVGIVEEDYWVINEQYRMFGYDTADYREVGIKADGAVFAVRRVLKKLAGREMSQ